MTPEYTSRLIAADVLNLPTRMFIPVGCQICDNTGYKGRVGLYEILVFDEQMRSLVRSGVRDDEMRNIARSSGMRLMQEDALEKIRRGITTLDEVMRVIPFGRNTNLRCTCGKLMSPNFLFCPFCGIPATTVNSPQPLVSPVYTAVKGNA